MVANVENLVQLPTDDGMGDYKARAELLASLDTRGHFEYVIHRSDLEDEYLVELIETALKMRAKIASNKESMKEKVAARERRIQMLKDLEKAGIEEIQKTYQVGH